MAVLGFVHRHTVRGLVRVAPVVVAGVICLITIVRLTVVVILLAVSVTLWLVVRLLAVGVALGLAVCLLTVGRALGLGVLLCGAALEVGGMAHRAFCGAGCQRLAAMFAISHRFCLFSLEIVFITGRAAA